MTRPDATTPAVQGNGARRSLSAADGRKHGAEFAGGEGAKSAEAGGEFEGGDAALAVKPAEEIGGGLFAFLGIAIETARNEVAIGIAAGVGAGDDVIHVGSARFQATQAIEAETTVAGVNGFAESARGKEVERLEIGSLRVRQ